MPERLCSQDRGAATPAGAVDHFPPVFQLIFFQTSLLAREHCEALHSGCGMPLIACQALPCASLVGALLAEIPVELPTAQHKRPR